MALARFGFLTLLVCFPLCLSRELSSDSKLEIDQDYVLALGTANRFLCAWQSRDTHAGIKLLSVPLKAKRSEEDWNQYISGVSNPHHESFEISSGIRLGDNRISFEVLYYEHYTGVQWRKPRPVPAKIILRKAGLESWLVDEVP
jgi:hypothetical protein